MAKTRTKKKQPQKQKPRPGAQKATKATAKKTTAKKPTTKVAVAPARGGKRTRWLDAKGAPAIESYARRLGTFMDALADGRVDDHEVKEQEARLVALMKQIEPQLGDALHAQVTQLLCELTAFDLMQILNSMNQARPRVAFRG